MIQPVALAERILSLSAAMTRAVVVMEQRGPPPVPAIGPSASAAKIAERDKAAAAAQEWNRTVAEMRMVLTQHAAFEKWP